MTFVLVVHVHVLWFFIFLRECINSFHRKRLMTIITSRLWEYFAKITKNNCCSIRGMNASYLCKRIPRRKWEILAYRVMKISLNHQDRLRNKGRHRYNFSYQYKQKLCWINHQIPHPKGPVRFWHTTSSLLKHVKWKDQHRSSRIVLVNRRTGTRPKDCKTASGFVSAYVCMFRKKGERGPNYHCVPSFKQKKQQRRNVLVISHCKVLAYKMKESKCYQPLLFENLVKSLSKLWAINTKSSKHCYKINEHNSTGARVKNTNNYINNTTLLKSKRKLKRKKIHRAPLSWKIAHARSKFHLKTRLDNLWTDFITKRGFFYC